MGGDVARDGSPVGAYAALPPEPELGIVRRLIRGRSSVLDLGCGTGRIADPLALDGHHVVAVDESPEMIQRVRHAPTVLSSIESLRLQQSFDSVLLLSHLVNGPSASNLLESAARHLDPDGVLVIQRLTPGMAWRSGASSRLGPVVITLEQAWIDGSQIRGTTAYAFDGEVWRQSWQLSERTDEELRALLEAAGLSMVTADRAWVTARLNDHGG